VKERLQQIGYAVFGDKFLPACMQPLIVASLSMHTVSRSATRSLSSATEVCVRILRKLSAKCNCALAFLDQLLSHTRTVVGECYKDDDQSQWGLGKGKI